MGPFGLFIRHLRILALTLAVLGAGAFPAFAADTHGAPAEPEMPGAPAATSGPSGHEGSDAVTAPGEAQHDPHATQHDATAADHGEGGEHGGLPQLNSATFPSQIFWLIVTFLTLYYLLSKRALPRVAEILEARQDRIAADLDRAARLRTEAEEASRRYEEVLAQAQAKAAAELKATQERLAADAARRQSELEADLNRRLEEAEARIATARDQALGQIQNVAVEVAQAAVERLSGLRLPEAEVRAALDRELREAA